MLKLEVPENDQSVYELKPESGQTHFVRCPGTFIDEEKEGLFCFVVDGDREALVMFSNTRAIVEFTKRPDVRIPNKALRPSCVLDLMQSHPGKGAYGFQLRVLA